LLNIANGVKGFREKVGFVGGKIWYKVALV